MRNLYTFWLLYMILHEKKRDLSKKHTFLTKNVQIAQGCYSAKRKMNTTIQKI